MPEALGKSCITADPDQAGNMDFTAFAFVEPFTEILADGPMGAGLWLYNGRWRCGEGFVGLALWD